jgi:death-on-curing family protein
MLYEPFIMNNSPNMVVPPGLERLICWNQPSLVQRIAYGEPDLAELAAAYAYGIARNHPFVDGNKRTAFVVMELFLNLNNVELDARDEECVMIMLQVAEGSITEERLVVWIRERIEA